MVVTRQANKSSENGRRGSSEPLGQSPHAALAAPSNLTSPTRPKHLRSRDSNTIMSSQDAAVRHQAVVPDKIPTGEYPVSQLLRDSVCNAWW
jgi:hypothetical protein